MKKIVILSIAVLLTFAAVGLGTNAYFSDTEASTSNVFSVGTLDLKLTDANETDQDGVTASFGGSALAPGSSVGPATVTLKNTGSLTADHVDIKVESAVTDYASYNAADLGANIADMSTVLTVSALSYGATDLLATSGGVFTNADIEAADNAGNNDLVITMNELDNVIVDSLAAPAASGGTVVLSMTVGIPTSVGNGIQGDQVDVTVTFGLYQDASQHIS
jgi:predicted ribosomally synthesized peptide with SipW-like signal peptide